MKCETCEGTGALDYIVGPGTECGFGFNPDTEESDCHDCLGTGELDDVCEGCGSTVGPFKMVGGDRYCDVDEC